ncbi:MAG TPA: DUF6655 family protein, partial [Tepidisphaeraceae bacterium]
VLARTPLFLVLGWMVWLTHGCATIRVTDTFQTADQQFLLTEAANKAVSQLSLDPLRGRSVWVLTDYAFSTTQPYNQTFFTNQIQQPTFEGAYMVGELRARLLQAGARLAPSQESAEVMLEVRTGALAINRVDFLLGLSAFSLLPGTSNSSSSTALGIATSSNLALYQSIKQNGFAAIAIVAYWRNTGELLAISGPFIGRTYRHDNLLFGYQLPPLGNIPPTEAGSNK